MTIAAFSKTVLAASLLAFLAPAAFAQQEVIVHSNLTDKSPQYQALLKFKELVEERTAGAFEVKLFPNSALGDDVEAAQQIQTGAIHAAPMPSAALSNFNPSLQLIDLPFLFPSREVTYEVLDSEEVGGLMLANLEKSGFVGASVWENGFKQMTCNHPVRQPSDFEGRKVRVMQSPLLIAQFEAVGAAAIPIAFPELYTALQQGVVECQENPLVTISVMRFFEVQDYLTLSNHGYLGSPFIFSKIWFDQLDEATREVLLTSAREAGQVSRELAAKRDVEIVAEIKAAGTTEIIELSDEERDAFAAAMRPVHEQFADRIGRELLDAANAKIKELSSN